MKSVDINDKTIKYVGTVKITILNDKKPKPIIKHNAGTANMFNFIARALAGESVIGLEPNNIMLQNVTDSVEKNLLYTPVSYDSKPVIVNTDNSSSLTMTFFIPGTIVISGKINRLQLISAANNSVMATLTLDEEIEAIVGSNIKVEWILSISN